MPSSPEPSSRRAAAPLEAPAPAAARVAYFSMEAALDPRMPTYSGGLGVLAGDFLRSAADLRLPLVGVTLGYRDGYFSQRIGLDGHQVEAPASWDPAALLQRLPQTVEIELGGRRVVIAAWQLVVAGVGGGTVAVVFLHTDVEENAPADRDITDQLYGGDREHRLRQEAVLGIGGLSMLRELGYDNLTRFHMNEGHASLLTLRLLEAEMGETETAPTAAQVAAVRSRCAFTTHTPVPAGHDRFAAALVRGVLGERRTAVLSSLGLLRGDVLNMTSLGTALSGYVNAVSRRHAEVTRAMLPGVDVASITNGVHHVYWSSPPMQALFDEHLAGWRADSSMLRYASGIPLASLKAAHAASKRALLEVVRRHAGVDLDAAALTIGLARRVTPYKRTLLLFSDPDRLRAIADRHGPLQIACSGKAHPRDGAGKEAIAALVLASRRFAGSVRVVFLENYDLTLAGALCSGCDLWLNTPQRPLEASGTSGMKAAMNGVPSLSILDGWWIEGWVEGVTGWAIGDDPRGDEPRGDEPRGDEPRGDERRSPDESQLPDLSAARDAAALYDKLEGVVAPAYFGDPESYLRVRRSAIALNGSFFSTDRMAREYARAAYGLAPVV